MRLCYIDESGTPDIPGNTSHFVLAGLAIPIWEWKRCDEEIYRIKRKYSLETSELHIAWMLRAFPEQSSIANFEKLDYRNRRAQVESFRTAELLRLQRANKPKLYKQTRKNYKETAAYIHLTRDERRAIVREVAGSIGRWPFARLFAECIDKVHYDPVKQGKPIDEQAFEQLVSRFERYLAFIGKRDSVTISGLLIHDNNQTVSKKHTEMMKEFHRTGTLWTAIHSIIETPLYVDSQLTSMVQISDLCAYALRRYLENNETELFDLVFKRADRKEGIAVGVRHFTTMECKCKICGAHRKPRARRGRGGRGRGGRRPRAATPAAAATSTSVN